MITPIKPSEVIAKKKTDFPEAVINTWNVCIAAAFTNGRANIKQLDIANAIATVMNCERQQVFDSGWLDIEEIYRSVGWKVVYDKPGYNEMYEATFTFSH